MFTLQGVILYETNVTVESMRINQKNIIVQGKNRRRVWRTSTSAYYIQYYLLLSIRYNDTAMRGSNE